MVMRLQPIGLGCAGFVLELLGACSGQVEDVSPKRIKISFGYDGLGLLPLWFHALHQLGFVTKFYTLDPCFSGFSFPGFRLQDAPNPDAVPVGLAPQAARHCSSCIFVFREAQLVLAEQERLQASQLL